MSVLSNNENLPPHVIRGIIKEVTDLIKNPIEDVKILSNDQDVTDIQVVITGPTGTPYAGGLFKAKLVLGKDYPKVPPKGFFLTKIFHPNVASNGEICVNTLKKDWNPMLGIKHVLMVIKCLLIVPNPESALNEEAGKMLLDAYSDYANRARMMTEIHAQGEKSSNSPPPDADQQKDASKKSSNDKKLVADKKKIRDKKRALKRL